MTKFITLAVLFLVTGVVLIYRVKAFSRIKAKDIKGKIIVSVILTFISFVGRGLFTELTIVYGFEDSIVIDSIKNDDWIFPIFINVWYITVDLVPIIAQVISVSIVMKDYNLSQGSFEKPPDFRAVSRYYTVSFFSDERDSVIWKSLIS